MSLTRRQHQTTCPNMTCTKTSKSQSSLNFINLNNSIQATTNRQKLTNDYLFNFLQWQHEPIIVFENNYIFTFFWPCENQLNTFARLV